MVVYDFESQFMRLSTVECKEALRASSGDLQGSWSGGLHEMRPHSGGIVLESFFTHISFKSPCEAYWAF